MIDVTAISSENTNLTLGRTQSPGATARGYSRFSVNGADGVAETSMSFSDVVDMINPLQHIPVVSSVYRAVADEPIHPVSRIMGDALYGGVLSLASAGFSAVGAICDEAFAASNGGQSASGVVVAALFGNDATPPTQLAEAAPPTTQVAETTPPAPSAQIQTASAEASTTETTKDKEATVERAKQPYGGVMDTSLLASAQQNQALAMAMAAQNSKLQAQRTIRNNRFEVAAATPTTAKETTTKETAPKAAPTTSVETKATPETQAALDNLLRELQAMKGISQYQNAAQMTPAPTSVVNSVN